MLFGGLNPWAQIGLAADRDQPIIGLPARVLNPELTTPRLTIHNNRAASAEL